MTKQQEYSPEQQAAISACNDTLTAVKLPTYSQVEESLCQALVACMESIEMGKRLYQTLNTQTPQLHALRTVLNTIIISLPTNKDWLDPDVEKVARKLVATKGH